MLNGFEARLTLSILATEKCHLSHGSAAGSSRLRTHSTSCPPPSLTMRKEGCPLSALRFISNFSAYGASYRSVTAVLVLASAHGRSCAVPQFGETHFRVSGSHQQRIPVISDGHAHCADAPALRQCRMARTRHYVGPSWPSSKGAYDYVLALCPSDLAWEFLRRSPTYQRDYRLNCKGISQLPRSLHATPRLTRVRRRARLASFWGLHSFIDPALPAPNAPLCWETNSAAPLVDAIVSRTPDDKTPDFSVRDLSSARHVVLGPTGEQYVLLRDADAALTLRLRGCRASRGSVSASILFHGLPEPGTVAKALGTLRGLIHYPKHHLHDARDLLFLRDALVALDGRCVGASYREMATLIYGSRATEAAWSGNSRWMKDRMCRALARGEQLRDGGYRNLME